MSEKYQRTQIRWVFSPLPPPSLSFFLSPPSLPPLSLSFSLSLLLSRRFDSTRDMQRRIYGCCNIQDGAPCGNLGCCSSRRSVSDMANLDPFIQCSLEWSFNELFSANASLWNEYKYIAFNMVSCRIVIILYKMLIIRGISNEKTK